MKNTLEGMLLSVKLHDENRNFTKINTPPWVFFTFFKIEQMVTNGAKRLIYLYFEKFLESNLGVFSIIEIINTYIRHPLEN